MPNLMPNDNVKHFMLDVTQTWIDVEKKNKNGNI